jgi:hypothetical protein
LTSTSVGTPSWSRNRWFRTHDVNQQARVMPPASGTRRAMVDVGSPARGPRVPRGQRTGAAQCICTARVDRTRACRSRCHLFSRLDEPVTVSISSDAPEAAEEQGHASPLRKRAGEPQSLGSSGSAGMCVRGLALWSASSSDVRVGQGATSRSVEGWE